MQAPDLDEGYDVVVVGAGNAALCAALAARESGARVAVLERATKREHGGNSRFTMASMRFAYDGVGDLMQVAPQLTAEDRARADFGAYTEAQYLADLDSTSGGRCDPDLAKTLVGESRATLQWMAGQGVRFVPLWGNQSFVGDDGRHRFWGGLTLQAARGGPGLVLALRRAACKAKIRVIHETRATALVRQRDGIAGVEVEQRGERRRIGAGAVVLACGGFEANADWRAEHLGAPWRFAKVRGTRHNTGDGIAMALQAGARAGGQWSGCHAVQWDRSAPDTGDLRVRHAFQKHSYPLGILVNARGERFVDEGFDFRNYTYARYGRAVLEQPGRFAWQIFDARTTAAAARRVRSPSRDARRCRHARGAGPTARRRRRRAVPRHGRAVQRGGRRRASVRSGAQGRAAHARARRREDQLGESDRSRAVSRLRRHLRHHLHLRRPRDRPAVTRARRGGQADPGSLRRRRAGRRVVLGQLSGRGRAHGRRRVRAARRHRSRRRSLDPADTLRAAFQGQGRSIASHDGRGACRAGRIG